MKNMVKPMLLAVVGILAVVLILQGSNLITGRYGDPGATDIVTTLLGSSNLAPWADSFSLYTLPTQVACGDSSTNVTFTARIHDLNGYGNITTYTVKVYNTNTTTGGTACTSYNGSNCMIYTETEGSSIRCSEAVVDVSTKNITCTMSKLKHYSENGTWAINVTLTDGISTTSNSSYTDTEGAGTRTQNLDVMYALDAQDTINFGSVSPGGASSEITNAVRNCGNWLIDNQVNATTMDCTVTGGTGTITSGNISASPTSGSGFLTLESTKTLQTNTSFGYDATPMPTSNTYWKVAVPTTGVSGSCQGNATFIAVING